MMFRAQNSAMVLKKKKNKPGYVGKQLFKTSQVSSWHGSPFMIKIKLEYLGGLGFFHFVINKSV